MSIYTYNGAEFSEEDVIAKAKEKGMDLNSYINKFGIEKIDDNGPGKKKPVVVGDATVAGTKNMASKSAKPSSVSQDNPFGKVKLFDPLNITKNALDNANAKAKQKPVAKPEFKNTEIPQLDLRPLGGPAPIETTDYLLTNTGKKQKAAGIEKFNKKLEEDTAIGEQRFAGSALRTSETAKKAYDEFSAHVNKITPAIGEEVINEANAELSKKGETFDITASTGSSAAGSSNTYTYKSKPFVPFENEQKSIINSLKKSGKLKDFNASQIEEMAKDKWIQSQALERKNEAATEYLNKTSNIDDVSRGILDKYLISTKDVEQIKLTKRSVTNEALVGSMKVKDSEYSKVLSSLKPKDYKFSSQAEVDEENDKIKQLDNLGNEIRDLNNVISHNFDKMKNSQAKIESLDFEYDLLSRDYSQIGQLKKLGTVSKQATAGLIQAGLWVNRYTIDDAVALAQKGLAYIGADELAEGVGKYTGKDFREELRTGLSKVDAGYSEELSKDYAKIGEVNDVSSFLLKAEDLVINQIPTIALMALTGGISGAAEGAGSLTARQALLKSAKLESLGSKFLAAQAAGSKYSEMLYESKNGTVDADGNLSYPKYSPLQMLVAPMIHGYAEGVADDVMGTILSRGARVFKAAKNPSNNLLDPIVRKNAMNIVADLPKAFVSNLPSEEAAENFTNLVQNFNDKVVLGKDVSIFANTGQVIKDTALMTGLFISAPHIAGAALSGLLPTNKNDILISNAEKMRELTTLMQNPSISKAETEVYKQQLDKLSTSSSNIIGSVVSKLDDLSDQSYSKITKLADNLVNIRAKAKEINESNSETKDAALKTLLAEYKENKTILNNVTNSLSNFEDITSQLPTESKTAVYSAIVNSFSSSSKSVNVKALEQRIENIYENAGLGEAYKAAKLDPNGRIAKRVNTDIKNLRRAAKNFGMSEDQIQVFESPDQTKKFLENNGITGDAAENIIKSNGVYDADINGKEVIFLNKHNVMSKGLFTTGQHEMLHKVMNKAIESNPDLAIHLGKSLFEAVDKHLGDIRDIEDTSIGTRLKEYQKLYKEGKYSFSNYMEEVMPLFSEALTSGEIKYEDAKTFIEKVREFIYDLFPGYFDKEELLKLDTGEDVVNFIKEYNKGYAKGGFSKAINNLAKNGKFKTISPELLNSSNKDILDYIETEIKPKVSALERANTKRASRLNGKLSIDYSRPNLTIEEKLAELSDMEENGEIDDFEYEQEVSNLKTKQKLQASKPKTESSKQESKDVVSEEDEIKAVIKENKATIASDKVQKIYDQKGISGAQEIIDLFKPITRKIVNKRRDAPGFDEKELTSEIEVGAGGLFDLIRKYDASKGVPLAAYINKNLPLRAIASSKRILDKEFSKDVTEEKGIMADETVAETKEKPKYANVLESNVFEPEVLENANKKILSIVRTLKSKVDEPITINRTVTPLIAEIKEEIGKQFDIDVKTAMGGKKDNQHKNWLLKNKKYILENMTTTWLMGKGKANKVEGGIPNAIQKKIDGEWVSYPEWIGKIADRESVSTDNAGRTSGAELVRRLPNVANNVSNEEFLSHILEPSGNPIRGRKESLAKAIAEESAFDIINNDLENKGPIYDAMAATQERLGAKIANDLAVEIAKQSERGNSKFSIEGLANGYNTSRDKLAKDILNAETALEESAIINKWIASDGRSIRTIASFLKGKFSKLTTNRGIFENILLPIIKTNSKFQGKLEKDSYNLVSVPKGESIYFGTEKVPLWLDINYIKSNWDKAVPIINEEVTEAVDEMIDIVNYFKDNKYTKEDFKNYLGLLRIDQRGLIRKMFKAGLAVENMDKSLEPYLEHNATNVSVANKIIDFFDGKITEKELRGFIADAQVNLVPKKINDYLPKYEEGKNRMHAPKVVLYLQSLIDKGYKISNIESEYGSRENFDALVREALTKPKNTAKLSISEDFNKIIEENEGVENYKNFSDIVARRRGIGKNKFDFYVPASAADFELLLYNFMGKGSKGEEQKKFFSDTLLKPYANGNDLMDAARQSIKKEYKQLLGEFPSVAKMIEKRTPDGDFTYDQAIRVAMWNEEGVEIPGLSQRDSNKLTMLVNSDEDLKAFKDGLIVTGRQGRGWIKPEQYWDANTIITDLHNLTEGEGRKKFLSEFIANTEEMFGKFENGKLVGPNMNKVEAVYGTDVREALEDVLYRMITGKNKSFGKDKETSAWANWVSGSTGAIMFLNVRSAALQLIGAVNFLNLRDNNPYAAAKAFANQKQYWEDFATIWNSDKMKERRRGLKEDVAAAEIANAAEGSKNKVGAVLSYLLKIGYTPTQMADSFAIASGGAPFYRNRIKTYLKEGMTEQEAEEAAWDDFTKVSDETQQSGDPRDISKQQASPAGRLLLTFQNTAMQQSRIVKKAVLDLKNGRGDAKTNFAKIAYYVAIQNTMFAVLQQGLFAVAFGDDDEDKEKSDKEKKLDDKLFDVVDGVIDTILRGTGFVGGIVATVKNMAKKYLDERDKKFKADYAKVVLEAANLSPPIGSKLRKLYSGLQQTKFDKDLIEARGWDVMQDGRINLGPSYGVAGKVVEAATNVPMDRLVTKINNASEALNSQNTAMQRIMVGLGWSPYSAGIEDSAGDKKIREEAKAKRKIEGVEKAKETRERTKDSIRNLPMAERIKLKRQAVADRREKRRRRKMG
jgi:hypothetical protein